MTLVLSMNPFCEHDGDAPLPQYQPIWESERCSKSCVSSPTPPEGAAEGLAEEPHCRRAPDHVTMSRIAYFKRKYVEDEDPQLSFRSYCQSVAPALEERAHVLRLSLEKMRFIDDPEAFLRRSVLINNLLRRIRTEILMQSEWCLPTGSGPSPCLPSIPAQGPHSPQSLRPCFTPPGPYRKRFRLVRGDTPECIPACCCFYAAGRYLHLPFSVYDGVTHSAPHHSSSSSSSSPSASTSPRLFPLEDRDKEAELDSLTEGTSRSLDTKEPRTRQRDRTASWESKRGHSKAEDRQRERAGGEVSTSDAGGHSRWSADAMETAPQGPLAWSQVGHK
ncbi:SERTA domain-containing protein 4 [Denticeps clupeoides]|uniref:SERTA domain-containing protein n=1 Tax=Denticeps clupeoides TaxID=299321 RepID=A0AAY4ACH9_9TELE|nr:SERTA domain-containing protein 4 [Denticeps clupeoides]